MLGISKIKALLFGLLVGTPAVAVWIARDSDWKTTKPETRPVANGVPAEPMVRVPVEVIAKGSAPEWVYIEVASQAIPKPRVADSSR